MEIQGVSSNRPEVIETKRLEQKKADIKKETEVKEFKEEARVKQTNKYNEMKIESKDKLINNQEDAKKVAKEVRKELDNHENLRVHDKLDEIRDKALSTLS